MTKTFTVFSGANISENASGGLVLDYVTNASGSVATLLDSGTAIVSSCAYWPYGEISSTSGTQPHPFAYAGSAGYYKDVPSRLYVRMRHLRADLCIWLSKDPTWPNESPYSYASGTPLTRLDFDGLQDTGFWTPDLGKGIVDFRKDVDCAYKQRAEAESRARKICKPRGWGSPRSDYTRCNALYHCIGACIIYKRCGAAVAELIDLRDYCGVLKHLNDSKYGHGQDDDVHNNGFGRRAAAAGRDCSNYCTFYAASGWLRWGQASPYVGG